MTDPLSLSAATVGFVAFALQVAQTTAAFIQNASDFPQEFMKLYFRTHEFASHLRRLSPVIEKIEEEYDEKIDILKRCREVLEEINSFLKEFQSTSSCSGNHAPKTPSFKDRIKWAFSKKQKAGDLVDEIETCKTRRFEEENKKHLEEQKAAAAARQEASRGWSIAQQDRDGIRFIFMLICPALHKDKVLNWLSSKNLIVRHSTTGETHTKDTGLWLLQELQQWFDGNGPRLIICQGPRSIFSSQRTNRKPVYVVVQKVLSFRTPEIGLAYIYFEHQAAQSLTPSDYIANLVRQFEEQKEGLMASIQNAFDRLPLKSEKPSFQTLKNFLSDSVMSFSSGIYIILDGLDECKEDGREALVDSLRLFLPRDNRFRLFVATRPNSNAEILASSFVDLARTIEVTTEKVEQIRDLKQFIDDKLSRKNLEIGERSFLSEGIFRKAQGSLHSGFVLEKRTPRKRKKALASLSQTLNDAYEVEMMRIKRNGKHYEVAKPVLSWVYFAKRPLHMAELREALAVDPIEDIEDPDRDCTPLEPSDLEEPQFILECCGGLILWDRATDIVGFSHYTVSEFFKANATGNIEPELYIARTCLTYLGFKEFETLCEGDESLRMRMLKYRFAGYAGEFWAVHTKKEAQNDDKIQCLALKDFGVRARRQAIYQFAKQPVLHITAHYGLSKICALLLDKGEIEKRYSQPKILLIIRESGVQDQVDVMERDEDWRTALHVASQTGHKDVVALLLDKMSAADAAVKDKDGLTALHGAAFRGHKDVVTLLLAKMDQADVAAKTRTWLWNGSTALHFAVEEGHDDVVALLLDITAGSDVSATDWRQKTALHLAAENGHKNVVALLLDKMAGADVAAKDWRQRTAMHYAAQWGYKDVVTLLLDKMDEADVAAKDEDRRTALHKAARWGHKDVVDLLLDKMDKANIAAKDFWQSTALHEAAVRGNTDVVALLLYKMDKADIAAKTQVGGTAMHERPYGEQVVALFLDQRGAANVAVKFQLEPYDGWTALHLAETLGHKKVVALLKEALKENEDHG